MGLLEVLTVIFVVMKLCGVLTWSWWWVFSPAIFSFVVTGLIVTIIFRCAR